MIAERANKLAVREVFQKLARDEVEHKHYLRDIASRYEEVGVAAFSVPRNLPDMRAFSDKVFTERFRQEAQATAFEVSALSIGMQLETNAMTTFVMASQGASDGEVRDFYQFLADWEQQHLNALHDLYGAVRGDFFASSGFSPF
jgi:rubrerythrin